MGLRWRCAASCCNTIIWSDHCAADDKWLLCWDSDEMLSTYDIQSGTISNFKFGPFWWRLLFSVVGGCEREWTETQKSEGKNAIQKEGTIIHEEQAKLQDDSKVNPCRKPHTYGAHCRIRTNDSHIHGVSFFPSLRIAGPPAPYHYTKQPV